MAYIWEQHGLFRLSFFFWEWTLDIHISQPLNKESFECVKYTSSSLFKPFLNTPPKRNKDKKNKDQRQNKEHSVGEHGAYGSETKSQLCLHIYFWGKTKQKNLCSPMYSGRHYLYIPGIYTMQPLEGHAAYIIKQEGLGGGRAQQHHHNQAPGHSRKSASQSETKGVWYLWRSETASQALHPLSSLYTEEEQFMELFLRWSDI